MRSKYWFFLLLFLIYTTTAESKAVSVNTKTVLGIGVRVVEVDLGDPHTILTILLANNAPEANSNQKSYGDEPFGNMVQRAHAAAVINGTFFSKDAQMRVMGNMVRNGQFVKYSQWENFGTTFGLMAGNQPEMVTARDIGSQPAWHKHWFSLTCGPRLLKDGQIWLNPILEGFQDPHVLGAGARSALGFTKDGKTLLLVSFIPAVTLQKEAEVMKALGLYQAMNLDGGASKALAISGRIQVPAGRKLTNVIAVYDQKHPAPTAMKNDFQSFQMALLDGTPPVTATAEPSPEPVSTSTPPPNTETPPMPLEIKPDSDATRVVEVFFHSVHRKIYDQAWDLLTDTSKDFLVKTVVEAINQPQYNAAMVRYRFDRNDKEIAQNFWIGFRDSVNIDMWLQQSFHLMKMVSDTEAIVRATPLEIKLKVYKQQGQWKFGLAETFFNME